MKESLEHLKQKSKSIIDIFSRKEELLIVLVIILVGLAAFGLGRLSVVDSVKNPIEVITSEKNTSLAGQIKTQTENNTPTAASPEMAISNDTSGRVVASRTGKTYHLPWCPGALKIKEENKIWFNSSSDAEAAGLTKAGNCKGL